MKNSEMIPKVEEAQEKLLEAIEILDELDLSVYFVTYLVDKLRIYASDNHGFLTNDPNLDQVIEKIREEGDGIPEEDEVQEFIDKNLDKIHTPQEMVDEIKAYFAIGLEEESEFEDRLFIMSDTAINKKQLADNQNE